MGEVTTPSYEFRFTPKAGGVRWAQLSTVKIIWEERPAILALFTDITEHKMIEKDLKTYPRRITET